MRFGLKIVAISAAVACANFMVAPILTEVGFSTVTEEATNRNQGRVNPKFLWDCDGCNVGGLVSDVTG